MSFQQLKALNQIDEIRNQNGHNNQVGQFENP